MEKMNIEDIIHRYLSRLTSEEENKILLQWLEEKDENQKTFKELYDLWLYTNASFVGDNEIEVALDRLKERISFCENRKKHFLISRFQIIKVAASLLILLTTGYIGYKIGENKEQTEITYNHLLTGINGKGEYILPDSSTVWLNANSVLKYPETFSGEKRVVQLEGEALFEVKKDISKPFFVETRGMNIEVVGTRFLVNNYANKNIVETVLVNGHIKISGSYFNESRKMNPGELITYNKKTKQTNSYQVNTNDYTNWIYPKLVFDKTNLAQIITNLEKWFNVEIIATPELIQNTHMSFTVRRESIEDVVTYMSLTAPISYKWDNGILYLSSRK